jgi:predicted glycosyl hydrolase (DUF1957 family)
MRRTWRQWELLRKVFYAVKYAAKKLGEHLGAMATLAFCLALNGDSRA